MRTNGMIDTLFPAVRTEVLSATMLQPEHWWFMAELARHLEITPSSLQRELESLVSSEILLRRQDERRTYFKANTDSPLFPELKGMIERTARIMPPGVSRMKFARPGRIHPVSSSPPPCCR